jgi:hypothetical protein
MQEHSRMQPPAALHSTSLAHPRVVHQIAHRVRLRPHAGRWTSRQKERVAAVLRHADGVQSFRISDHSLTVHHSAPLNAVIDSVQRAVAEPRALHAPAVTTWRAGAAPGQRGAARRLLACAVVSLAIALLPQPVAPAMILLRLLACGIAAAVRCQAAMHAKPCALTRFLDALACLAGFARADNLLRELLKHCAEAVLKPWAEARLRQALA